MNDVTFGLLIVLLLLMASGVFAMAEMALTEARKSRLKELAEDGDPKAAAALAMAEEPTRFISTVQMGITLVAVLAGAFASDGLTTGMATVVARVELLAPIANPLALGIVVIGITLAAVVFGELVPKRIALQAPEVVALHLARPLQWLSRFLSPVVALLTFVAGLVLKPFGLGKAPPQVVSDEEVNSLIEEGFTAGIFNKSERDMVAGVLELDQLTVLALMTPRPKMIFLNLDDPEEVNWRKVVASGHSHFPVFKGNRDHVVGMVSVKSIWANNAFGAPTQLRNLLTPPLIVPESLVASQLLEQFKKTGKRAALIADEFGVIQGIATLIDVLEAIVGDLPEPGGRRAPAAKQRDDGSWLVDATLGVDELKELINVDELPDEEEAEYQTLGGFVMTHFGRVPAAGDRFDFEGWRFEVLDMDRHRIDKVLLARAPTETAAPEEQVAG